MAEHGLGGLADTDAVLPQDAGPPLVVADNLIANSSFEEPNTLWFGFGNTPQLDVVEDRAHTGRHALKVTQRHDVWAGPALDVGSWLTPGASYRFRVWVLGPEDPASITVSSQLHCDTDAGVDENYAPLVSAIASDGEWVELDATFDAPTCAGMEFVLYVEGPPADVAFHIDDASLIVQD